MPLSAGDKLGPYEILARIGAGGMGEVWKAHDTRLNRDIAIKVSAAQFSERFEQEARAIAALNHTNICAIYDVGPNYLVMELVEGPTLTMGMTEAGMILGTAAYMAPEQARGKNVDKRADIWAFGVVFHEMLTGKRLFQGDDMTDTLASVLKEEPRWEGIPPELDRLLRSCLQKDPKDRLRDIGDAWKLLEAPPQKEAAAPAPQRMKWLWPGVAAMMTLLAAGIAGYFLTRAAAPVLTTQFTIEAPPNTTFTSAYAATALSPDGRYLVFAAASGSARSVLWLRPLDSLAARPLPGTDGVNLPFWSPDSKSVAFFAGDKLKRVEIAGGAPLVLCDATAAGGSSSGAAWSRDGVILFAGTDGLHRVAASGGIPTLLTKADASRQEIAHASPQFLPDGKSFLFFIESGNPNTQGIYAASLDRPQERVQILRTNAKALYAPPAGAQPGYLLWLREQTLLAQRFDAAKLRLEGDPSPIAEDVALNGGNYRAAFWTSDAGLLAYRTGPAITRSKPVWIGRDGKQLGDAGPEDSYSSMRLSPDGKRVAIGRYDASNQDDIWLLEFARGVTTRFTFDPKRDTWPAWSPDGRQIAFSSARSGVFQIYRNDAGGAGQEEQLTTGPNSKTLTDWSRDGRYLLYFELSPKTRNDLWALPLEGERKPILVLQTAFDEDQGYFSPDGKWIAYTSYESGQPEVYVRAFSGTPSGPGGKWQVSNNGGWKPKWRGDGKELFYLKLDKMMAAGIRTEAATVETDTPRELFPISVSGITTSPYDVTADGQRFLVEEVTATAGAAPLTVLVHWQAGLK